MEGSVSTELALRFPRAQDGRRTRQVVTPSVLTCRVLEGMGAELSFQEAGLMLEDLAAWSSDEAWAALTPGERALTLARLLRHQRLLCELEARATRAPVTHGREPRPPVTWTVGWVHLEGRGRVAIGLPFGGRAVARELLDETWYR